MRKHLQKLLTGSAVAGLWLLSRLPYGWQLTLGKLLGKAFFLFGKHRRQIARTNLALCFPELDETRREQLLRKHFAALGMGLFEAGQAWWGSATWVKRYVVTEGLDYVRQAQAAGKAVILLSGHFTPLELSLLVDIPGANLTYRPHENPLLDRIIKHHRLQRGKITIARTEIRTMLRTLKDKGVVWIAPDQNYRGKTSIQAPFFGIPVATTTLIGMLAKRTQAVVIPFFVYRKQNPTRYVLHLSAPLENFHLLDERSAASRVNRCIEEMVAYAPEQYFWVHRRFKGMGGGNPYRPDRYQ